MKLLKIYFITALVLACITFFAAGAVAVDENAKKISLGEEITVIRLANKKEREIPVPFLLLFI